ncbi:MAG TPA: HAD family hydrolase [Saprospiraceae bacterium]|nr:HAD family hydrolase [Saprospiraceae bacterium]HPN70056.1 HAD family hydrolase [Saprospiraceae bacterium]
MTSGQLKVIAFDADDTLWVNETFFREAETSFCNLLEDFMPHHSINQELYRIEVGNIELYGYGIKAFMLSMIQTASVVTENKVDFSVVDKIMEIGHDMMNKPVELLDGVQEVIEELHGRYKLVVATKGDLVDQERKLAKSGLDHYFHHIEIMSEKRAANYQKLIKHLDCHPSEFLMIGNSIKSDVLPVIDLGGNAIHIPFHTTWEHEVVKHHIDEDSFISLQSVREILDLPFIKD